MGVIMTAGAAGYQALALGISHPMEKTLPRLPCHEGPSLTLCARLFMTLMLIPTLTHEVGSPGIDSTDMQRVG